MRQYGRERKKVRAEVLTSCAVFFIKGKTANCEKSIHVVKEKLYLIGSEKCG